MPSPPIIPGSHSDTDDWVAIIDDDPSIRRSLTRAFASYDIRVEAFGSAEQYLGRASESEPSCLVLDIQLGGLSGFELQNRLQSQSASPPAIIFISAHADMLKQGARFRRAHGFLQKPFDIDELVGLVRPLLRRVPLSLDGYQ